MGRETTVRIDGKIYRLVATVDEGRTIYFSAGPSIAVEKFDMRPGGTEFDFQVNSRQIRNGRPDPIMAMQSSMDREFIESRVKSNLFGLPVSYGNLNEMRRQRRLELSYGELKPQVFTSKVQGDALAWRIWFKRAHYAGNPSAPRIPKSTAQGRADASAAIRAASAAPGSGQTPGDIGPLTNQAGILRVYVRAEDKFQVFGRPFDIGDAIFRPDTIMDRITGFITGRSR